MLPVAHYYIKDEVILGYYYQEQPYRLNILASKDKIYRPLGSCVPVNGTNELRKATKQDFDNFNVSWKGHVC